MNCSILASHASILDPLVGETSAAKYELWYRHNGEPDIKELPSPFSCTYKVMSEESIRSDIGTHSITHMHIKGDVPPSLPTLAPEVSQLGLRYPHNSTELGW